MNSRKIEMNSIIKLKERLERCLYISTDISDNDRTPSWDGDIFLYNSIIFAKSNIRGVIRVQVKGKKVNKLRAKEISYSIDVADIKNFRKVGGTILFVIYMVDFDNYRIYYNALLPLDLEEIANNLKNEQSSVSVKLRLLPFKNEELLYVLSSFDSDSKKQHSFSAKSIQEHKKTKYDNLTFSTIVTDNCFDNLLNYPVYLYGRFENLDIEIPISKVMIHSISNSLQKPVKVDNEVYYDYIIFEKGSSNKIIIGSSVEFFLDRGKFNYTEKGSLDQRIKDTAFLIALIKNDFKFKIGDVELNGNINKKRSLTLYEERLNFYNRLKDFLIKLKVKKTLDLDEMQEENLQQFERFREAVLEETAVNLECKPDKLFLARFKFSNLVFIMSAKQTDDQKYFLRNIFEEYDSECILKKDESEIGVPSCLYVLLEKDNFLKACNIDYELITKTVVSVQYSEDYGQAVNNLVLEMLSAFDECNNNDLINSIIQISEWLSNKTSDQIYKLNYYQALLRIRELNNEEIETIIEMKFQEFSKGKKCSNKLLAGISVLLKNEVEFDYYFNKMNQEEQICLTKFPINNLANKIFVKC